MNPHNVIADSGGSAVVGPETNANQPDSPSCCGASLAEPSLAQVTPHPDESDESGKWLEIERFAPDPGRASAIAIRSVATPEALGKVSLRTAAVVAQEQAEDAWPLTLDEVIKKTLVRLLRETSGNRRRTASLLGISRSTLYRMLARYGIDHVGRAGISRKSRIDAPVPPA